MLGFAPVGALALGEIPVGATTIGWFVPLGEPRRPKRFRVAFQQFFAAPPQLRPTPTLFGTLAAIETKDSFMGAIRNWDRITTAEVGVIATVSPAAQIGVAMPEAITSARIAIL